MTSSGRIAERFQLINYMNAERRSDPVNSWGVALFSRARPLSSQTVGKSKWSPGFPLLAFSVGLVGSLKFGVDRRFGYSKLIRSRGFDPPFAYGWRRSDRQ